MVAGRVIYEAQSGRSRRQGLPDVVGEVRTEFEVLALGDAVLRADGDGQAAAPRLVHDSRSAARTSASATTRAGDGSRIAVVLHPMFVERCTDSVDRSLVVRRTFKQRRPSHRGSQWLNGQKAVPSVIRLSPV